MSWEDTATFLQSHSGRSRGIRYNIKDILAYSNLSLVCLYDQGVQSDDLVVNAGCCKAVSAGSKFQHPEGELVSHIIFRSQQEACLDIRILDYLVLS